MIYIAIAITATGTAAKMLVDGYAKAEPYIPATRQTVRAQRSWSESEHEAIRGSITAVQKSDRVVQQAILCTVDATKAAKLNLKCDL